MKNRVHGQKRVMDIPFLVMIFTVIILQSGCAPKSAKAIPPTPRVMGHHVTAAPNVPSDLNELKLPVEPNGVLTLRKAISLALMQNPELAAFSFETRAAEARALQESLPPNPEAGVTIENFGGSGAYRGTNETETTLGISQLLETGRKRQKRARVAELETELAGWDYQKQRVDVLTEVALRFIDVLAAQQHVELARQNAELASQVLDTVDKQIKAGKLSSIEHDKQSVETVTTRVESERAQRRLTAARHQLAATWGSSNPHFEVVTGDLAAVRPIPPIQALADLVSQNPDVARWTTEMAQRRAALDLAKAQGLPDVTASMGVRRLNESDDTALVFELSLPLPIFNRNQAGVSAAQLDSAKTIQEQRAAEIKVKAALLAAYEELAASYAEVLALRDEGLPAAQRAFDGAQEAFAAGQFDYLSVLDAQRTLIETRSQYIDALAAYHRAIVEVEGLVGSSIETFDTALAAPEQKGNMPHDPPKKQ